MLCDRCAAYDPVQDHKQGGVVEEVSKEYYWAVIICGILTRCRFILLRRLRTVFCAHACQMGTGHRQQEVERISRRNVNTFHVGVGEW